MGVKGRLDCTRCPHSRSGPFAAGTQATNRAKNIKPSITAVLVTKLRVRIPLISSILRLCTQLGSPRHAGHRPGKCHSQREFGDTSGPIEVEAEYRIASGQR